MRAYIRHPFDVTIQYMADRQPTDDELNNTLKNISAGGLCFQSAAPLNKGSKIHIRIPIADPPFEAEGIVVWCHENNGYSIGVKFIDETTEFSLRMVEQACYIKHYMHEEQKAGRNLSTDEAAQEWIMKYASAFPR